MNKDPVILSYEESLLRKSDVDLLQGPHWLNDNIISFYFEYLKKTYSSAPFMLFVSPEVTQCIKISPTSQVDIFLGPLEAITKRYIFFALNDNDRVQAGGTHWSLALYSRVDQTVYHYDSSRGSNSHQAATFAQKVFDYFKVTGRFSEELSVQQDNGYDCGIYLICNAECLARHLSVKGTVRDCDLQKVGNSVGTMRNQIVNIIETLR